MRTSIGILLLFISIAFADSECLLVPITLVAISVYLLKGVIINEERREDRQSH